MKDALPTTDDLVCEHEACVAKMFDLAHQKGLEVLDRKVKRVCHFVMGHSLLEQTVGMNQFYAEDVSCRGVES